MCFRSISDACVRVVATSCVCYRMTDRVVGVSNCRKMFECFHDIDPAQGDKLNIQGVSVVHNINVHKPCSAVKRY